MFNKILFNRNAFDRSVSSSSISMPLAGSSLLRTQLIIRSQMPINPINGLGNMSCNMIMRQQIGSAITSTGTLTNNLMYLRLSLSPVRFSGSGILTPKFSIHTPFRGNLSGMSVMNINNRLYFLQCLEPALVGKGIFNTQFIMHTEIEPVDFSGKSIVASRAAFFMPLQIDIIGSGGLILRHLSAVNENILELIDMNLLPGETVTIDTDLLQVLLGAKEDVSIVTSDSIFFELNPGENEVSISTDSDTTLDVTAVWQNRWL